eukprot:g32094.t1
MAGLADSSRETYMTGVRSLCVDLGVSTRSFSDTRVARAKRAVKRLRTRARRVRLPIAVCLAARLLSLLDARHADAASSMLAAFLCVGIYGLLRSGEMVSKDESASSPLLHRSVVWDPAAPPQWADLHIPASRTDYLRQGATVRLWANGSFSCPVARLARAWARAPDRSLEAPVFQSTVGKGLSSKGLQESLRSLCKSAGLDPSVYSSHRLRIEGATSLAWQA